MSNPILPASGDIVPPVSGSGPDASSDAAITGAAANQNTPASSAPEPSQDRSTNAVASTQLPIERARRPYPEHEDVISHIRYLLDSHRSDPHPAAGVSGGVPPQFVPTSNTSPIPVANTGRIPIGVRAQRSGSRGVDIHVHWADQEEPNAAAPPRQPPNPPPPSVPAEALADPPAQPANPNMGVPAVHTQAGAPFPVTPFPGTPVPVMMTQPVMTPSPVIVMTPGFVPRAQPIFQAPAIGTGTWYRESPFYTGTAHWRTNPPFIVNAASAPFPVVMGQPSHVIMYR